MTSVEDIYRKYIDLVTQRIQDTLVSQETAMIHLSELSDGYGVRHVERAPIKENILYTLLLLRSKKQESVLLAKSRLSSLLRYQNEDGSFPVVISELGLCIDWLPSFHILVALFQILREFSGVLGQELNSQIEKTFSALFNFCKEIVQEKKGSCLMQLLFSSVALDKGHEEYRALFFSSIEFFILETSELFDPEVGGDLIQIILPRIQECIAHNSRLSIFREHLSKIWGRGIGYVGPTYGAIQSGYEVGIGSRDIALSLIFAEFIKEKVDVWPVRTLFACATLFSIVANSCMVEESVSCPKSEKRFGIELSSSKSSSFSWIFLQPSDRIKKGCFPIHIRSESWDFVFSLTGYTLQDVVFEKNKGRYIASCMRSGEGETIKEGAISGFLSRKEDVHFYDEEMALSTYFDYGDAIIIGKKDRNSPKWKIEAVVSDRDMLEPFSWRVRLSDRSGQVKILPQHIIRARHLPYHSGHDWLLELYHPRGVQPEQLTLSFELLEKSV